MTTRYLLLNYQPVDGGPGPEEWGEQHELWSAYDRALKEAGVFVANEGLGRPEVATTVRVRGGKREIVDGPFAETKEYLAGYFVIDVPDLDAALDWAARMPASGYGSVEVRPVWAATRSAGDWADRQGEA
ncbi:YciI family protein [Kitasatospora sp. NPDC097643]|uniref:YciI family protein n=1 Tax=Kitasatospora sp. NPDC097643 TaxID=3157230 RepID=UPI0033170C96